MVIATRCTWINTSKEVETQLHKITEQATLLKKVHWDDPEGWYGEGGGSGVQDGEHMYTHGLILVNVWQKPPQYCEVISLQLK